VPLIVKIEAAGRLVLPGGVDSHCHLEQIAASGARSADDFFTGSVAAACSGTTTIIPFSSQLKGESIS
jgi:dihydropyrimidinase